MRRRVGRRRGVSELGPGLGTSCLARRPTDARRRLQGEGIVLVATRQCSRNTRLHQLDAFVLTLLLLPYLGSLILAYRGTMKRREKSTDRP